MSTQGVGGQKKPKSCQHSWWTTPYAHCSVKQNSLWLLDMKLKYFQSKDVHKKCFQEIYFY